MVCQYALEKLNNCLQSRSGGNVTNFRPASVLKVTHDCPSNYRAVRGGCIDITWKHVCDSPRMVFMKLSNLEVGQGLVLTSPPGTETPETLL